MRWWEDGREMVRRRRGELKFAVRDGELIRRKFRRQATARAPSGTGSAWWFLPAGDLSLLAERLLALLGNREMLSLREAAEALNANRNTLKDKFTELVQSGYAEWHHKGRGAHYLPRKLTHRTRIEGRLVLTCFHPCLRNTSSFRVSGWRESDVPVGAIRARTWILYRPAFFRASETGSSRMTRLLRRSGSQ